MMKFNYELKPKFEAELAGNVLVCATDFDTGWERPGKVKRFTIVLGDSKFEVDLTNGDFIISGERIKGIEGLFGDYSLVFFKRNKVNFNQSGGIEDKNVSLYFGYKIKGKELLFKIDLGFDKR